MAKDRDITKVNGEWTSNDRLGLCLDTLSTLEFVNVILDDELLSDSKQVAKDVIKVLMRDITDRM